MGNFTAIAARGTIVCVSDQLLGFGLVTAPKIPEEYRDHSVSEPVTIRDFAVVGTNSVILPGVVIPEGAVIGACSLVRKSDRLKPWTIYAGNPLKEIAVRPKEKMLTYAAHLGFTQS
jgi:galactoside O-acetyltransferase